MQIPSSIIWLPSWSILGQKFPGNWNMQICLNKIGKGIQTSVWGGGGNSPKAGRRPPVTPKIFFNQI